MLSPNGICAIFFDLDGTLRFSRPAGRDYFMDTAQSLGVLTSHDQRILVHRWESYYFANSPELKKDNVDHPDIDDFWLNYSRRQLIAMSCSDEQAVRLAPVIHQHMNENYTPEPWVNPTTTSVLAELKAAGYLLGVITNRDQPFSEELRNLGLEEFFSVTVFGGEAGSKKPDAGIFHYTLTKAGVAPHESMYIGDNYFADVVGARNAGIHPILLDTDSIFYKPGCPSIKSLTEIPGLLGH